MGVRTTTKTTCPSVEFAGVSFVLGILVNPTAV